MAKNAFKLELVPYFSVLELPATYLYLTVIGLPQIRSGSQLFYLRLEILTEKCLLFILIKKQVIC
jgi:hypothetical protein